MVRAAEHGAGAARERAQRWLQHHFVTRDGAGHWSISSPIAAWPVVVELRELTADEVPGLHAPFEFIAGRRDQLNEVRRPVASRDYPAETTR
jgi:hypothetical protein